MTKNIEHIKKSPIKYSSQATFLLDALKDDFPFEQFEAWIEQKHFIIGGAHVLEFLAERKKLVDNELNKLANLKNV